MAKPQNDIMLSPNEAPSLVAEFAEGVRAFNALFNAYRPELHYMRGPGPKWHAKHRHAEHGLAFVSAGAATAVVRRTTVPAWGGEARPARFLLAFFPARLRYSP